MIWYKDKAYSAERFDYFAIKVVKVKLTLMLRNYMSMLCRGCLCLLKHKIHYRLE